MCFSTLGRKKKVIIPAECIYYYIIIMRELMLCVRDRPDIIFDIIYYGFLEISAF